MPTEPLTKVLDRDLSIALAKDSIERCSSLLQELVNHATNAIARCATSPKGDENEDAAVLFLYYHVIEMTDGIEAVISQGCSRGGLVCLNQRCPV